MKNTAVLLILGNQLFPLEEVSKAEVQKIVMIEDRYLCQHFNYHQHKLVLILSAMRAYARALREAGYQVSYHALEETAPATEPSADDFLDLLQSVLVAQGATQLVHFEVEGKAMQARLANMVQAQGMAHRVLSSPMFLCSREDFADFLQGRSKPQMASFYKFQRSRLGILLDGDAGPVGGRWSFDQG